MIGSSFRRIVGPVAALVVAAAPLHAAPRISMTVDVGFNTICRPGRMVPCRITVDNPGNAFAGTLTAERQAGESKWRRTIKANVSAGGRSIYTTTCSSSRSYPDLVFSLFNENGRRVATDTQMIPEPAPRDVVLCALGESSNRLAIRYGMTFIGNPSKPPEPSTALGIPPPSGGAPLTTPSPSAKSPIDYTPQMKVAVLSILGSGEGFETPSAYTCADIILLTGFTPRDAKPEAMKALQGYIASGGVVIVTAAPDVARFSQPFYRGVLPGTIGGPGEIRLPGGGGNVFYTPIQPNAQARVFMTWEGRPILTGRPMGLGGVFFLSIDPTTAAVQKWSGYERLLARVLSTAYQSRRDPEEIEINHLSSVVREMPSSTPPSMELVGLFLLAYVMILVPANYMVMARRDKRELTWITTPIIVMVFTLLAWVIGVRMRGGDLILNQIATVIGKSGDTMGVTQVYGAIFAPASRDYTLAAPIDTAVSAGLQEPNDYGYYDPSEMSKEVPILVEDDEGKTRATLEARMWTTSVYTLSYPGPTNQPLAGTLRLGPGGLTGLIRNVSRRNLGSVRVHWAGGTVNLGRLKSGATVDVTHTKGAAAGAQYSKMLFSGETFSAVEQSALAKADGPNSAVVTAYVDEPVFPVSLSPKEQRRQSLTAYATEFPVSVSPGVQASARAGVAYFKQNVATANPTGAITASSNGVCCWSFGCG
ncbi:MAG: hypothetical protein WCL39_07030 [Armatimonadota bacterium]